MDCIKLMEISSILFQLVGSIILFLNSPINEPTGSFIYSENPNYDKPKKKNISLKWGFGVMLVGFCIQLLTLVIHYL